VIAAWATFGTRNYAGSWAWRVPSLLQVLLPLVGIPGLIMIPESPRWLVSVDRIDEARKNLADLHAGGDIRSPLIEFEMAEIQQTIQAEKEAEQHSAWTDLWATSGNRHRLFISISLGTFAQWSGNGVVSYYLSIILNSVGITSVDDQTLISACLQIWNLIWAVTAAMLVDRLGRRMLFMTSVSHLLLFSPGQQLIFSGHRHAGFIHCHHGTVRQLRFYRQCNHWSCCHTFPLHVSRCALYSPHLSEQLLTKTTSSATSSATTSHSPLSSSHTRSRFGPTSCAPRASPSSR